MIYRNADKAYVASSGGAWLPGRYATRAAARYAFQFEDRHLIGLRDRLKRPITSDDLKQLAAYLRATQG